ncbi:MAG TPA: hypothetical protein DDY90_01230 [Clostridiales bacterium]|nr:hypothetical protein [Clostridiales bacterium]HBK25373.1 hypothetical protein [Clostridiales bacterium]
MPNKSNLRKSLSIFTVLMVLVGMCIAWSRHVSSGNESMPKLQVFAVQVEDAYVSETVKCGISEDSEIDFSCIGLRDVTIAIDETAIDFESALREGKISLAELSFLAQSDALSGLCTERWESKNGLARFCYSYPAFDLWIIHDIYETPDGQQHLVQNITLCEPGSDISFVYNELDQEDWGIEFSVEEASPSEITLSYTQSGGQQIGQLMTCGYEISRLDPMEPIARLDDAPLQEQMPISMDAKGSLTLDIETYFGTLPAGQYGMYLYLQDTYSEEDIPPLTRNFHDTQCYWIDFDIS